MTYTVVLTEKAKKQLSELDKQTAKLIVSCLFKHLQGCTNPRQHGKGLTSNLSGYWRCRVGDYRLIADIQDSAFTVLILEIKHRRSL